VPQTNPADAPVPSAARSAGRTTLTRNTVRLGGERISAILTSPTKVQRRAFDLIGVALSL